LLVNSVKSFGDIMSNTASWPEVFHWGNYAKAWKLTRFPEAFMNSLVITVISVLLIALISAMGAYRMVRWDTKVNRILFFMFIAAMVIPFQSIMIPLMRVVNELGVNNTRMGLILTYLGLGAP